MSGPSPSRQRLLALSEVVLREVAHLRQTDARLFARPFDEARVASLETDLDLSERVDAFVARFGRLGWLQDVEQWLAMRRLRNLMVHEYVGKPAELAAALAAGHGFVPRLCTTAEALVAETRCRFAPT